MKPLKVSDLDAVAQSKWDDYTAARDTMLARTHTALAPWHCVRADNKKKARVAVIRHLLQRVAPPDVLREVKAPDPDVLFAFEAVACSDGRLSR